MIRLGVNLDDVAAMGSARGARHPDLAAAAHAAWLGGADLVLLGARGVAGRPERDLAAWRDGLVLPLALEVPPTTEGVARAVALRPALTVLAAGHASVVPSRGIDATGNAGPLAQAIGALADAGLAVAVSVDPDEAQLVAANGAGADVVELHTGRYAGATTEAARVHEYLALARAAGAARSLGLRVLAAHGLDYGNVARVAALADVEGLHVGHAVAARAIFCGLQAAVAELRERVARAPAEEATPS